MPKKTKHQKVRLSVRMPQSVVADLRAIAASRGGPWTLNSVFAECVNLGLAQAQGKLPPAGAGPRSVVVSLYMPASICRNVAKRVRKQRSLSERYRQLILVGLPHARAASEKADGGRP